MKTRNETGFTKKHPSNQGKELCSLLLLWVDIRIGDILIASQRNVTFPEALDRLFMEDDSKHEVDDLNDRWEPDTRQTEVGEKWNCIRVQSIVLELHGWKQICCCLSMIYIYIFPVLLWDGECGWDGADCPGIHNPDLLIYSVNSRGWRGEGAVFSYNSLNMTLVTETELLVYTKCFDLYCRLGVGCYIRYIVTSPHPSTHTDCKLLTAFKDLSLRKRFCVLEILLLLLLVFSER